MLHLEREARGWSTYNEYSYRIVLLLLLYVCCSRAHPHFPSQFRRRRLQDLVHLWPKHTKYWVGRQFTFFSGRQANFYKRIFANTLLYQKENFLRAFIISAGHRLTQSVSIILW